GVYSSRFNSLAALRGGHDVLVARHDFALFGDVPKVDGWLGGDSKWRVCQRMHHGELGSVQHRPWRVSHTVEPVTDDRMPYRCQMDANLMCPAGLQCDFNERSPGRRAQNANRSQRAFALLANAER